MENYQSRDCYNTEQQSFGGGIPVWVHRPSFRIAGGMLTSTFRKGELIHAGSPVEYNAQTHIAKILKCFKIVSATVSGSNTVIGLAKNFTTPELYAGINLMVAPSAIGGTGKAVTVSAVDISTANQYVVTVVTANVDAIVVGGYLVEATAAGSGVSMYCQPNTLLLDDLQIGNQNTVSIPKNSGCVIYRNTMPDVADVVLNNVKSNFMVEFEYYPEIQ
jgi:hypothetical protein